MARKISYAALGLLVIVGGLLVLGELSLRQRSEEACGFCARSDGNWFLGAGRTPGQENPAQARRER